MYLVSQGPAKHIFLQEMNEKENKAFNTILFTFQRRFGVVDYQVPSYRKAKKEKKRKNDISFAPNKLAAKPRRAETQLEAKATENRILLDFQNIKKDLEFSKVHIF